MFSSFVNKLVLILALLSTPLFGQCKFAGTLTGPGSNICSAATGTVSSVAVQPSSITASSGTTVHFEAFANLIGGTSANVTTAATWSSSNTAVATIGGSADPWPVTCTANANGTTTISATYQGVIGTAVLSCFPNPVVSTTSVPGGFVGTPYSTTLAASGGVLPYTWSLATGSLPNGLGISSAGVISGTPTTIGIFTFQVQVTDQAGGIGLGSLSIQIQATSTGIPQLPKWWACELESYGNCITGNQYTVTFNNVVHFNNTGVTSWSCHGNTFNGGITGATLTLTLNQTLVNAEFCRTLFNDSTDIEFDPGTLLSFASSNGDPLSCASGGTTCGVIIPQSTFSGTVDTSTSPIILDSSVPVPTGNNANGVARIGSYAIASSNGLVRSGANGVVTVTPATAMAAAPKSGSLVTIQNTDDRSFTGQYTICTTPTAGCIVPTTTSFTYLDARSTATTQNGVIYSFQYQNTVSSATSSNCSIASEECYITLTFASLPACGTAGGICGGDRVDWVGATPSQLNATWYVCNGTSPGTGLATCPAPSTNTISIFSYTEFIGNTTASVPGKILSQDYILTDQRNCCMYTIEYASGSGGQANIYQDQAHNYGVFDAEIRSASTNTQEVFNLLPMGGASQVGAGAAGPGTLSNSGCNGLVVQPNCIEPVHIGYDRDYIHGYSWPQVGQTTSMIRGAFKPDCGECYITNSWISEINSTNNDAEVIGAKSGTGGVKIVNNYIEGGSEDFMAGSYQGCNITDVVTESDWEIRKNTVTKNQFICRNAAVKSLAGAGSAFNNYIVKNIDELKNGARVLKSGNIFEMSCGGSGQQNGAISANNSTEDNGNDAHYQQCNSSQGTYDLTDEGNIRRHGGSGIYLPGRGGVTLPTVRLSFAHDVIYDLANAPLYNEQGWTGNSFPSWTANTVYATGSTIVPATPNTFYYKATTGGTSAGSPPTFPVSGCGTSCSVVDGTVTWTFQGGVNKWGGVTYNYLFQIAARLRIFPNCTGTSALVGGQKQATLTCTAPASAPSMVGIGIAQGDPVSVIKCSDPNFNVLAPNLVPNLNPAGFNSFTIIYNAQSGACTTVGCVTGCTVAQAFGWPQFLSFIHNTVVIDFGQTDTFHASATVSPERLFIMPNTGADSNNTMARNVTIKNNLFSITGLTPDTGSGNGGVSLIYDAQVGHSNTASQQFFFDTNTHVFTHNVFSNGATAAAYTEYNAPFGVPGANHGASPPVTDVFLANLADACGNINSPTASCFGFVGNRASANVPDFAPSTADVHLFKLVSNSNWAAGQPGQADDGTDMGASFSTLDFLQTLKTYVCNTSCGTNGGPYP